MEPQWRELVLQWINCFFEDNATIKDIHDIKGRNFLSAFPSRSCSNDNSFETLLQYLQGKYPEYSVALSDPNSKSWSDETELYLLAMLLLLHASVFEPSEALRQSANTKLNESTQRIIVPFLAKAMSFDRNITKENLILCIPQMPNSCVDADKTLSPSTPQFSVNGSSRVSTPLEDFLSSPVARRSRMVSYRYKQGMIVNLEAELENAQSEKEELVKKYEAKIKELTKQFEEKRLEVRCLEEHVSLVESGAKSEYGSPSSSKMDRAKLRSEMKDLQQYVNRLEKDVEELSEAKMCLQSKVLAADKTAAEWESRFLDCKRDYASLSDQVKQQSLENESLMSKISELEACRNSCGSPKTSSVLSPNMNCSIPSPAPESLGHIVEMKLIQKEKENEELQTDIVELERKLSTLQSSYEDLQNELFREKDSSSRSKAKYESREKEQEHNFVRLTEELENICAQRDKLLSALEDLEGKYETTAALLQDVTSARDAALSKMLSVNEAKDALEVKVAQLNAKLRISEETQEEFQLTANNRASEIVALKQEQEAFQAQVRSAFKERDKMEQNLTEMTKKRDFLQRKVHDLEVENESINEKALVLKQENEDQVLLMEKLNRSNKELQEHVAALSKEKESLNILLTNVTKEKDNVSATCTILSTKNNHALAQIVSLTEEKERIEAQLKSTMKQRDDACTAISKVEEKKQEIQDKVELIAAENERLSCQVSIITQQENDLNMQLEELSKEKKLVEKQLWSANQEIIKHKDAFKESASQLSKIVCEKDNVTAKLSAEIDQLISDKQQLQHTSNALASEKENLEYELSSSRTQLQRKLAEVSEQLTSKESEVTSIRAELDAVRQQCKEKDALLNDLLAEKSDMEGDIYDYLSRFRAATEEILSLKAELDCLSKQCVALSEGRLVAEEEVNNLKLQCTNLLEEKDALLVTVKDMVEKNGCVQLQLSHSEEVNSDLRCKFDEAVKMGETLRKSFEAKCEALQKAEEEKSLQLLKLQQNYSELESNLALLKNCIDEQNNDLRSLEDCKTILTNQLANNDSKLELTMREKDSISLQLMESMKEKNEALSRIETLEAGMKSLLSQLEVQTKCNDENLLLLKNKEALLMQHEDSYRDQKRLITSLTEKLVVAEREKDEMQLRLDIARKESEDLSSEIVLLKPKVADTENLIRLEHRISKMGTEFDAQFQELLESKDQLEAKDGELKEIRERVDALLENKSEQTLKLQSLDAELKELKQAEMKAKEELNTALKSIFQRDQEIQLMFKEKEELKEQLNEACKLIQGQKQISCENDSADYRFHHLNQQMKKVNDNVMLEKDILISSLQEELRIMKEVEKNKPGVELLDVNNKQECLEQHGLRSESEILALNVGNLRSQLSDEREISTMQIDINSQKNIMEQKIADSRQQISAARSHDGLAQLEQDENIWQLDRAKSHLESRLDGMMTQKYEIENHLSQLRTILEDVGLVCDNVFRVLPANCDAVHEVTNMKKEVENKLRAIDKKYADSLCGVIKSTYDLHKWIEKQTSKSFTKEKSTDTVSFFSEKDDLENNLSSVCDVMRSLVTDVRAAFNSCKFLSDRCESYLKAQTRESLVIKMSQNESNNVDEVDQKASSIVEEPKENWFGGACTLAEGYALLKESFVDLKRQVAELNAYQKEKKSAEDSEEVICKLQAKVNALMLRPSQEQVEEKLKELHIKYNEKLEGMKLKMKQVVKEEVHKVEQDKSNSEREIIAKYNQRISEFEEHIQGLSSQLWELGEKLLQEEQDHRNTQSELAGLKERQQHFLNMYKHRTKSLDRFEALLHGTENQSSVDRFVPPKDVPSHASRSAQPQSRAHSFTSLPRDSSINNDITTRPATKMAPASMGLAFPEEDEDGEVFNNDYLTELKEGRCRPPADNRRLSELQFRNSLCPPHLKSSYPLETQFHDPKVCKEEELKGQDEKVRRTGKDRGTTSYKKPGPPTPSRKAGRLSLQGKDDLTPRAALREHNESQSSYGSGMLKVVKTTPSRLRSLFPSSKVANLPGPKRDENSTPGTPSSKRLSFFRKRFGNSKENHSMTSGYSTFR